MMKTIKRMFVIKYGTDKCRYEMESLELSTFDDVKGYIISSLESDKKYFNTLLDIKFYDKITENIDIVLLEYVCNKDEFERAIRASLDTVTEIIYERKL